MPDLYWLRLGRRSEGPFPLEEIRRRAVRGRISPAHSVSRDGRNWSAAGRCPEIYAADGTPVQPGQGVSADLGRVRLESDAEWDIGAAAQPADVEVRAPFAGAGIAAAAAWPAQLACAVTIAVACGLPVSRDAEGPLWWWHVVRLWDLGGAGLATAAIGWTLASASALVTAAAILMRAGTPRRALMTASAVACMALAIMAWAVGMAGGAWTLPVCALVPLSLAMMVRSAERDQMPARQVAGTVHAIGGAGFAFASLGASAVVLAAVAVLVRDGAAAMACTLLSLVAGTGAIVSVIRWKVAGPGEWTTMIPCGVIAMACGALLCDGLAAMAATPSPPSAGTRFAVLDAVRVMVVLLCQSALTYLAARDNDAVPSAHPAQALGAMNA